MEQSSEQSVQHEEYVQYGGLLTLRAREQLGGRERSSSAKGAKVPFSWSRLRLQLGEQQPRLHPHVCDNSCISVYSSGGSFGSPERETEHNATSE